MEESGGARLGDNRDGKLNEVSHAPKTDSAESGPGNKRDNLHTPLKYETIKIITVTLGDGDAKAGFWKYWSFLISIVKKKKSVSTDANET